jgi:hypothetical protein
MWIATIANSQEVDQQAGGSENCQMVPRDSSYHLSENCQMVPGEIGHVCLSLFPREKEIQGNASSTFFVRYPAPRHAQTNEPHSKAAPLTPLRLALGRVDGDARRSHGCGCGLQMLHFGFGIA